MIPQEINLLAVVREDEPVPAGLHVVIPPNTPDAHVRYFSLHEVLKPWIAYTGHEQHTEEQIEHAKRFITAQILQKDACVPEELLQERYAGLSLNDLLALPEFEYVEPERVETVADTEGSDYSDVEECEYAEEQEKQKEPCRVLNAYCVRPAVPKELADWAKRTVEQHLGIIDAFKSFELPAYYYEKRQVFHEYLPLGFDGVRFHEAVTKTAYLGAVPDKACADKSILAACAIKHRSLMSLEAAIHVADTALNAIANFEAAYDQMPDDHDLKPYGYYNDVLKNEQPILGKGSLNSRPPRAPILERYTRFLASRKARQAESEFNEAEKFAMGADLKISRESLLDGIPAMNVAKLRRIIKLGSVFLSKMQAGSGFRKTPSPRASMLMNSDELNNVLPSSLSSLAVETLKIKFWLDFTQEQLLAIHASEKPFSPIVVALDKSGSMNGARFLTSSAFVLALVMFCTRHRIPLKVFPFTHKCEPAWTLGEEVTPLLKMLTTSPDGSTSIAAAMRTAVDYARPYKSATVLLITDGLDDGTQVQKPSGISLLAVSFSKGFYAQGFDKVISVEKVAKAQAGFMQAFNHLR